MDETEAAKIRMWAFEQLEGFTPLNRDTIKMSERMNAADRLAAWVMSGKQPE